MAKEVEKMWEQIKKNRKKTGGGGLDILEEESMKEFLKKLKTP